MSSIGTKIGKAHILSSQYDYGSSRPFQVLFICSSSQFTKVVDFETFELVQRSPVHLELFTGLVQLTFCRFVSRSPVGHPSITTLSEQCKRTG